MPKLALAPLFVIWFGFGILPKALIAALIAFFPLFENTVVGLQNVEPDAIDLFRMLRANRWQVFLKLRLPNAVPYLFAGLRVSIVLSVVWGSGGRIRRRQPGPWRPDHRLARDDGHDSDVRGLYRAYPAGHCAISIDARAANA